MLVNPAKLIKTALAVLLLASLTLVAGGQSRSEADDQGKLLALENAWNLAEQRKDIKALNGLLAQDFVNVDTDGSVRNKSEFLSDRKDPAYRYEQIVNDNMKVHMYGNTAVIYGSYHDRGVCNGKPCQEHGRFVDTWVYQNGLWRCVSSASTNFVPRRP